MKRFYKLFFAFLFIPVAMLGSAELVFRRVLKVTKGSYHRTVEKIDMLGPLVAEADLIFIGDSRIEWGFKPKTIQDALSSAGMPLRCLNLAMPGSSGLDMLTYLEKRKIFPRFIVIGYSGTMFKYGSFRFTVPESQINSNIMCWRRTVLDYLQRNLIVCELDHASLRAWVSGQVVRYAHHEYDDRGGVNVWINGTYEEKKGLQAEKYKRINKQFDFQRLRDMGEQYRASARLFAKHGTRFITVRMPVTPDLYAMDMAPEFSLASYVNPILDMNFNESVCSPQLPAARELLTKYHITAQNELEYMIDGSHLSHEMSAKFSNDFARFFTQLYSGNPITSAE